MQDFYPFTYVNNYSIFGCPGSPGPIDSSSDVAALLERAIRTLRDANGLEANPLLILLAANPGFPKFLSSFVCLVFPPYSPFVIHDERHESYILRGLVHDLTRNLLMVISKINDAKVASCFGLHEPRFVLNLLNLYWRNNEHTVSGIVSSCQKLNGRFMSDLVGLAKPLLENIQNEVEHLQFLLTGVKQGRTFETARTFARSGVFAARCDTSCSFDRNMLYVDKDTVLLDSLAFLETLLHFASEEHYAYLLSAEVSTLEGAVQLPSILTNTYYLLAHFHSFMLSQKVPVYKMENLQDHYVLMFQRCLFYRCKIIALSALMSTVKYHVFLNPDGSADYCYNWLLILTQVGGEEYVFDRDVILDDLRDIDFADHVDTWHAISKTWLPVELEQLKAMVTGTGDYVPVETREDIKKIREITGIRDDVIIRECLESHNFDVSSAIIDLVNRPANKTEPVPIPESAPQPRVNPNANNNFSIPFLPKETRQAVLNYWDYVNRPGAYDDDYDDYEDVEGEVMPLNTKILYEELLESSDADSEGVVDGDFSKRNLGFEVMSPDAMGSHPRGHVDGRGCTTRTSRGDASLPRGSRGSRGPRGSRGRRNYNRKRNPMDDNAF